MNKVLVTGATGFVGEVLCKKLTEDGFQVKGVSRDVNGLDQVNYSLAVKNINAKTDWSDLLVDIDVVFHLAARVHVMNDTNINAQLAYDELNYIATLNFAKQALVAGVKRFIYVSSIKVNGELTDQSPFAESDAVNPLDYYGISKWKAEQALLELCNKSEVEVVVIRPPLVYGPKVKANFLSLLNIVNNAFPLPLACVQNKRSMIYVENLVSAIMLCATHPNAPGNTYLVCDNESVSTPDLIGQLASAMHVSNRVFPFPICLLNFAAKLVGKKAVIDRLSQSLEIDCSKIKRDLNWEPPFSLQQGLQKTVNWYLQTKLDVEQ